MVLHADKLRPAVPFRAKLHHGKLVRPHGARADVAHLTAPHQVVQRAHRLLDGDGAVEAVDLQQVEVRRVEAPQRGLDGGEDGLPREPGLVDVVFALLDLLAVGDGAHVGLLAHDAVAFGQDDELVAGEGVFFDRFADDFFRDAVGVDVGGVPLGFVWGQFDVDLWYSGGLWFSGWGEGREEEVFRLIFLTVLRPLS